MEENNPELWVGGLANLKDMYEQLLLSTGRYGMPGLIQYLSGTDFYTAPGSARGHDNYKGGLVEHSLKTYGALLSLKKEFLPDLPQDSLIICSLLHDLCKANFYKEELRNTKTEDGIWIKVPYYVIDDAFPIGHGEKSVIILQQFIRLTMEEIAAIRWHMGGFDDAARQYASGNALNAAAERFPLVILLHMADLAAARLPEQPIKMPQK